MTSEAISRWRLGVLAIACASLVMGSGFMACGSDDTTTTGGGGAGGSGNGSGSGSCDVTQCPDPPFTGLEKCCTSDGMCGVRSSPAYTCYPPGMSGTGSGTGAGGMGGGKL